MSAVTSKDALLEQLMYSSEGVKVPEDGITRLYKDIRDQWGGELLPEVQYGLKEAWEIISSAEKMDVAFAVRTNLTFNGIHDDDSPIHGKAVTFRSRDCLHVKAKYNEDWWIGRVVKVDAPIGFIPAPGKLKKLAEEANTSQQRDGMARRTLSKDSDKKPEDNAKSNSDKNGSSESLDTIPQTRVSEIEPKAQGPYEAVPVIRPIVLCGPSMRGFEITDLMHKALIQAMKKQFEERMEQFPVDPKCLKILKSSITANKYSSLPDGLEDITEEVYEAARSFKLMLVDLEINSPLPLKNSALGPILVHIKISNLKVLQNLIKQRGSDQKRFLTAQIYAATKLTEMDKRNFDVVLNEHDFNDAAEHLINYLEKYWRATRPYQASKKHHDSILSTPGIMMNKLQGLRSPKLGHHKEYKDHHMGGKKQENRLAT